MSRSDFWSIAATLIVAGIAYFVGGRVSAYGCIALGICIALYLLTTHKKEQSSSPVTLTSNPHQEVKQEANPTINVYAHPPEKPVAPAPRPKPKPTHNLHLHSCRMAKIEESMGNHGEMNGFHFPYNQSEPNAAVACIKNKSHEGEVAYVHEVRAALTFKDKDMHEIGHGVHQACWVDNHLKNASFDLEETHCIILAVMRVDDNNTRVVSPYIKEHMTEWGWD